MYLILYKFSRYVHFLLYNILLMNEGVFNDLRIRNEKVEIVREYMYLGQKYEWEEN